MRKFLLTLAVLCGTVGAWSQSLYKPGARTTTLEAGKKYFISVATWYGSACTNLLYNNNGTLVKSDKLPNVYVNDESYLFTIEEIDSENVYYVKNNDGNYLQSDNLVSTGTKTGITIVPYNDVKGSITCGNDVDACDENGNKIAYANITNDTPIVCVYKNETTGWRYINDLQTGKSTPFAFYEVKEASIQVTTNESTPIYYTIKNVRANAYAEYDGVSQSIKLGAYLTSPANLFYFTAGQTEGTYKIHNLATDYKCASTNSWTGDGIDWYVKVSENTSYNGYAISKEEILDNTKEQAWNDFQGKGTSVALYGGNDAGSVWSIEKYDGETPTFKMSTEDEKHLYFIKNDRVGKFVNFSASGTSFAESATANYGSYWYFVEKKDAENVPEGYKACYIYNAANDKPVQNHSNGYMSAPNDGTYPAKVYLIGTHENTYYGYVLRHDQNGWNDLAGGAVTDWGYDDAGSIWSLVPANKNEAQLKSEAAALKNNALADIKNIELADYYTYSDEAIASAKSIVEAVNTENLVSAVSELMTSTITPAMDNLKATAKGTSAPAIGDYIQLINRKYGKYLNDNGETLNGANNGNAWTTLWIVEAAEGSYLKLRNASTGKYIGQIRQSANVPMVDEADAKQFDFTNQTDIYAVFKETSGGNYAYGHIAGNNVLVGWEVNAEATQWIVSKVELEMPEVGNFYRFKHPTEDAYMLSDVSASNNKRLAMGTLEANKVSSIFYYGNDHSLLSFKNGCYLPQAVQNGDWTCLPVGSDAPSATFDKGTTIGNIGFYVGDDPSRAYYSGNQTFVNAGGAIATNVGYDWILEEVTSLPFTFKAAALGYATFNAPVAVQLPEGVKAYISEIQEVNKLMMTELANGVVPANTAVLLWNESVADEDITVNLTITENTTLEGTNSFVGTIAAENLNTEKDCYSLQKGTKGKVGFYAKSTGTKGGFKAWIEMPKTGEARAFTIIFDGEDATGIKEALGLENENVEIYDLSGRRLDKPAKGVNVIGGKTVIVR